MPIIPLKKPVTVDGVTYESIDFDPSIDALEAYEAAMADGKTEFDAIKTLMAFDDELPKEVVGKVRMSAVIEAMKGMANPFGSSPPSPGGEPALR
jgi:hypothetical protein